MNGYHDCERHNQANGPLAEFRREVYELNVFSPIPKRFIVRASCGTEDCIKPTHLQARRRTIPRHQPGELYDFWDGPPSSFGQSNDRYDDYTGELIEND